MTRLLGEVTRFVTPPHGPQRTSYSANNLVSNALLFDPSNHSAARAPPSESRPVWLARWFGTTAAFPQQSNLCTHEHVSWARSCPTSSTADFLQGLVAHTLPRFVSPGPSRRTAPTSWWALPAAMRQMLRLALLGLFGATGDAAELTLLSTLHVHDTI